MGSTLGAGGLALTLAIALSVGLCIDYLYHQTISDAESIVTTLSTVLTEQADRALQAIDLIQRNVIDDVAASGVTDEDSFVDFAPTYCLNQLLCSRIAALPQINAITIIETVLIATPSRCWKFCTSYIVSASPLRSTTSAPATRL